MASRNRAPEYRVEMVLPEVSVHGQGQADVNRRLNEGQGRLCGVVGLRRHSAGAVENSEGKGQQVSVEDGQGDNKMLKISIMTPC